MKLLHIDSSVLGPHSVSRQVSAAAVERLRAEGFDVLEHRVCIDGAEPVAIEAAVKLLGIP